MAAKSSPVVLGSHLQDIMDIGFGRWAKVEPLLARTACTAIQRLSEEDRKKLLLSSGSRIFGILERLITGVSLPDNIWYATADKAISAMYTIHPTPETLAATIVKKTLSSVFDCIGGDDQENDIDSGGSSILTTVQVAKLGRYLFVASHVAMNQLAYIESCVRKIQKQRIKRDKMVADGETVCSNGNHNADSNKVRSAGYFLRYVSVGYRSSAVCFLKIYHETFCQGNNINAELGLAASDDAMLDTLSDRAEKEIISGVSDENLIGLCAPFLSKLSRNFSLMHKVSA